MDLSVQVLDRDGWSVVLVGGEIDITTAPRLRERLIQLVGEGKSRLVIDLGGVGFLDSTGLGVLVGAARRARTAGGDVVLSGLADHNLKVFAITGLDQAFVIAGTIDEAVAGG